MKYEVGDVVRLKSGGPKMTVEEVKDGGDKISCVWFPWNQGVNGGNSIPMPSRSDFAAVALAAASGSPDGM